MDLTPRGKNIFWLTDKKASKEINSSCNTALWLETYLEFKPRDRVFPHATLWSIKESAAKDLQDRLWCHT